MDKLKTEHKSIIRKDEWVSQWVSQWVSRLRLDVWASIAFEAYKINLRHMDFVGEQKNDYGKHICVPNSWYISLRYLSREKALRYQLFGKQIWMA